MDGNLLKITPNVEKAKSLLKMAKERLAMLETVDFEKFPSLVLEGYYEVIKELAAAILAADGYKTQGEGAHKTLVGYLRAHYSQFSEHEIYTIDDLRVVRNKISYDGFFVDAEYFLRKKGLLLEIISKLSGIVEKKTGSGNAKGPEPQSEPADKG